MKKAIFAIIVSVLIASGGTAMSATGSEWMEDFKAAKARATLEGGLQPAGLSKKGGQKLCPC